MLVFGLKIAWFTLSLTGLLGSLLAIPAFARSANGYLFPSLYCVTNVALQGLFCLGMIWKMNPLAMPREFCRVQPALMGVSWSFMTSVTTCMTIATSLSILRPVGGLYANPAHILAHLRWHPTCCLLLIFFPMAAFSAYLVLALRFNAIQPTDGMACDATMPVWVRLLSYSGVPLLLSLPSFLLTCAAICRFYTHSPRGSRSFARSRAINNDNFTPVPLRRQSKFKSTYSWHEAKGFDEIGTTPMAPVQPTQSIDARSTTPSGTLIVEAIPSPPSSLSSAGAHLVAGRVPSNPKVALPGTRYHLPFQWRPPSIPGTERSRESPDRNSRQTPSPLIFSTTLDETSQGPTQMTTVSVAQDLSQRMHEAAPWLKDEKAYLRQLERTKAWQHQVRDEDDEDENYDAVSGSLRWIRNSDDTVSIAKSELQFARSPQRDDFEETTRRPSPADPSTYDAGLSDPPIPNLTRAVWRVLLFQLFSSLTQILATITSLVDMFAQHSPPSAFGTQHIALLLAAWAPPIVFGVIPWRRKPF
ncbi:hypothetical protein C8Q70DRAFT_1045131 [Cubamyces menziesii]|uniref:Uncharacterized protein n=1 Tax=Trametes cubensis TaxID=1111947 RepID=A0AAD7TX21_9APHY|nr:hypothetical protein C8Q70DRAFT_1045131 [Cubamyces menziesii]KAJ8488037.1 hypothetical protein ONZ51_g3807 [Trametes cubensis]